MRAKEFLNEDWWNDLKGTVSSVFGSGSFKVTLPKSARGNDVRDMQQALQALGYSVGPTGIDGIIGPYTRAAIKKFQLDNSINQQNPEQPSQEMVDLINSQLESKPELLSKLKPSTGTSSMAGPAKLKPLSQDAVTTGKLGQVLNFIAQFESNGNYNVVLGGGTQPLTKMTISDVYALQDQMRRSGKESTAVGRYQFVKRTLQECVNGLGLDPDKTLFDEKTQDSLIIYRLRAYRGLDEWLEGSLTTENFLNNLSKEFASMPSPQKGGQSYYQGVGSNKAGTNLQVALSTLDGIQSA